MREECNVILRAEGAKNRPRTCALCGKGKCQKGLKFDNHQPAIPYTYTPPFNAHVEELRFALNYMVSMFYIFEITHRDHEDFSDFMQKRGGMPRSLRMQEEQNEPHS